MTTYALFDSPTIALAPPKRLKWPKLPPETALRIVAILFGIIVTAIEAEILARASDQAGIGLALLLGFR